MIWILRSPYNGSDGSVFQPTHRLHLPGRDQKGLPGPSNLPYRGNDWKGKLL
ncbi:hypothetical protein [Ectobacillus panaciterrae]|uniref:hypothetical protein n=1 Tax=Ectobacillus panaciterrae TaxID=363872 RepID=UPI00040A92B3|nr:hypothetical protein [Ectobacillus panaciterrae]